MKKLLLTLSILVLSSSIQSILAQVATLEWALSTEGSTKLEVRDFSVQLDEARNAYAMGSYKRPTDFDPGKGVAVSQITGDRSVFFQKLDSNGNFIWAKTFQGRGSALGLHMVTDSKGNIYATGYFSGTIDFDPGAAIHNNTTDSLNGGPGVGTWVVKLDSSGSFLWVNVIQGAFGNSGGRGGEGASLCVDQLGNLIVVGSYRDTVDFDPGTGIKNLISSSRDDVFIQKLDSAGNLIWVKSVGGGAYSFDAGNAVTTDLSNNIYVTGDFTGTGDFDPNVGVYNLTAPGTTVASFVLKLSAKGNLMWANATIGNKHVNTGRSVATDNFGHVYVFGIYKGTVDFDPGAAVFNSTSTYTGTRVNIYIQKLDTAGNFIWVGSIQGNGRVDNGGGASITTSSDGSVFITGSFEGTVDLDPGSAVQTKASTFGEDVFIVKVDSSGNAVWVEVLETTSLIGGGFGFDHGHSIVVDSSENIYVSGHFSSTVDFDMGTGVKTLRSKGFYDIFLMKFAQEPCGVITGTDTRTECKPFLWVDGRSYTINNNTATHNFVAGAANGCDSVVALDLTITKVDASVTATRIELSANEKVASYQWLDCANNFALVPSSTSKTFSGTKSGSYAVAVTYLGCTDTSSCYSVEVEVGMDGKSTADRVSFFPNPVRNNLNINAANLIIGNIEIKNALGSTVKTVPSPSKKINVAHLPKGLYFVQIETEKGTTITKFIKQ